MEDLQDMFMIHSVDEVQVRILRFVTFANSYYRFFQQLIHILKMLPLFFKTLHTNPRIAHKMQISCETKHCIQNITNTSQKETPLILIPVRFVYIVVGCVVFNVVIVCFLVLCFLFFV